MKKIRVQSNQRVEIVESLAHELSGTLNHNESVSTLTFQNQFGEGEIDVIIVSPVCLTFTFDIILNHQLSLSLEGELSNRTALYFCLEGSLMHSVADSNDYNIINYRQNSIFSGNGNNSILHFPKGDKLKLTVIFLKPTSIESSFDYLKSVSESGIIAEHINVKDLYIGRHCTRTASFVEGLMSRSNNETVDLVFKHAAILNIIASQIEQYQKDIKNPLSETDLRGYDLDRIVEVEKFINDNLTEHLSIEGLSRISGLSPNKLQNGFRYLHNDTVNSYITDKRLELATMLFEGDKYNISEVVYMIGYSSRSYFSKIFKNKYGISPSEYVKLLKDQRIA